jgi:hypothetical protein
MFAKNFTWDTRVDDTFSTTKRSVSVHRNGDYDHSKSKWSLVIAIKSYGCS